MSQSRDEIAEQVVALAGSIGNEKAERMRELVAEARRKGAQASGSERPVIEECRLKKGERPAWFPNELLLDHVAAKAMQSTETPPNRACVDALTWHFAQAWKKAQPSGAPAPSVEEITRIVRDADQDFEGSGGSTRHWVRDCFLPALEKSGLRIVGAPAPASALASVEAEFVEVADCLRDRFDLLYRMNGTWNPRDAKETEHDEECLLEYDRVRESLDANTKPASAQGEVYRLPLESAVDEINARLRARQGEVCECGHGRAMHFDEDGDHNGACLYQMNDKPFCRCDMFRAKDKERA